MVVGDYMNTLFLYLHLLFIMLSIVNVICFMKLINKISSKQGKDKPEEYPAYHAYVSKKPKVKYKIIHKKESKREYNKDYTTEVMRDRISSIEHEIFNIKSGKLFTVLVDDKPLMRLSISADGEDVIDYSTEWDETSRNWGGSKLFHNDYQIPVIMKLHEAKRTAEKLNGKVALAEESKSVVYDYTKEQ